MRQALAVKEETRKRRMTLTHLRPVAIRVATDEKQ